MEWENAERIQVEYTRSKKEENRRERAAGAMSIRIKKGLVSKGKVVEVKVLMESEVNWEGETWKIRAVYKQYICKG